jgi:hypothetical protein
VARRASGSLAMGAGPGRRPCTSSRMHPAFGSLLTCELGSAHTEDDHFGRWWPSRENRAISRDECHKPKRRAGCPSRAPGFAGCPCLARSELGQAHHHSARRRRRIHHHHHHARRRCPPERRQGRRLAQASVRRAHPLPPCPDRECPDTTRADNRASGRSSVRLHRGRAAPGQESVSGMREGEGVGWR